MSTDFAAVSFRVGATISGLDDGTVEIQLARTAPDFSTGVSSTYLLDANGPTQFDGAVEDGWHYDVTVQTQPSGQTCTVTNGSGTISGSNVNVLIDCV
jgi:hypothetical protein